MKSYKQGLSVVLATHNEAKNLPQFLDAIKTIADEIIIVDGKSTDETVKIAEEYGAKVFSVPNQKNFHINKQIGIEKASYEWILQMDADEIITKQLGKEIQEVVQGSHVELDLSVYPAFRRHMEIVGSRDSVTYSHEEPVNGYFIARKNYFLGNYLMHSAVYPDGVIRLFRNGFGMLPAKNVHEQVVTEGGVNWLKEPMIHMSDPTFERYMWRANRYTDITAEEMKKKKIGMSLTTIVWYMFGKPLIVFLQLFFRHKGFLDGFSGFVWALMSGLHYPMAYMKYVESLRRG